MHAAYQLVNMDPDFYFKFSDGKENLEKSGSDGGRSSLDSFLGPDGSVDAEKMMKEWFPDVEADVFISHSRADKKFALALSGFLRSRGLKPFVDSSVWRHSDSLFKTLDDHYLQKRPNLLSHERSIATAGHVNMMLTTAITRMMDRCECVLFINTPKSITARPAVKGVGGKEDVTHSPWLFHEIAMLQLLRKRPVADHRSGIVNFSEKECVSTDMQFDYPTELSGISSLSNDSMNRWSMRLSRPSRYLASIGVQPRHPLDLLYEIVPPAP